MADDVIQLLVQLHVVVQHVVNSFVRFGELVVQLARWPDGYSPPTSDA
jgi:hypothetical protein